MGKMKTEGEKEEEATKFVETQLSVSLIISTRIFVSGSAFPRELSYSSNYFNNSTSNAQITDNVIRFSLVSFLNQRPMFTAQMFTLYQYCRITAVRIRAEWINEGTGSTRLAMCTGPFNDLVNVSTAEIVEKPRSLVKLAGPVSGMNRALVQKTWHTQQELGNPVYTNTYWNTLSSSTSTAPLDLNEPCVFIGVGSIVGPPTAFTGNLSIRATYHMQWFDLINETFS